MNITLSKAAHFAFQEYYLKPFTPSDETLSRPLDPKSFQLVVDGIARATHGAMHASRVAAYVKILHHFREEHNDPAAKALADLAAKVNLTALNLLHATQIAGIFHDAARENECEDHWDAQSSTICFQFFQIELPSFPENLSRLITNTIRYKDDKEHFIQEAADLGFSEDTDYLRQLIHDADCLDIMRVRKTFKMQFLDLIQAPGLQHAPSSILTLVTEIRTLIHHQGDQYRDCEIQPDQTSLLSPEPLVKNFDPNLKRLYELAENVYETVTADMANYSELQRVYSPVIPHF